MSAWRHRIRVWLRDRKGHAVVRDVMAQTSKGATRTAIAVERMLGTEGRLTLDRTEDLGHLGTDRERCPVCSRRGSLFPTGDEVQP